MRSYFNGAIIVLEKSDKRDYPIEEDGFIGLYKLRLRQAYGAELILVRAEVGQVYEVLKGRYLKLPMFITRKDLTKKLLQRSKYGDSE